MNKRLGNRLHMTKYLRYIFERERKVLVEYFSKRQTNLAKKVKMKANIIPSDAIKDLLDAFLDLKKFYSLNSFYAQHIRHV